MRIELLDPRWKQQKQNLADKQARAPASPPLLPTETVAAMSQRESSLAESSSISANLSRLARKRCVWVVRLVLQGWR